MKKGWKKIGMVVRPKKSLVVVDWKSKEILNIKIKEGAKA